MSRSRKRKSRKGNTKNGPEHFGIRLAADVAAIIHEIKARTGWYEREIVEQFMRTAQAATRGEASAGKVLVEAINAAAANLQARTRAEGLLRVAKHNARGATDRLKKMAGVKPPAALRQSA